MSRFEEAARAALLRHLGRPADRPEAPIRVETPSSISTRVVEGDRDRTVIEMRAKLLPLAKLCMQVCLAEGCPLWRLPWEVARGVLELRKDRFETVYGASRD